MTSYKIIFTKEAKKDVVKLTHKQKIKLKEIVINILAVNPHSGKKLIGDLSGFYSIRLTYKDRIVYSIDDKNYLVYIHRTKTHYGE